MYICIPIWKRLILRIPTMRKIALYICLTLFSFNSIFAQLTISGGKSYTTYSGLDYLFVFNEINANLITYSGTVNALTYFKWYKFTNLVAPFHQGLLQNDISPDDATGYRLEVDVDGDGTNKLIYDFWVIEYKKYLPVFNTFEAENKPNEQCNNVKLLLNANIPALTYQNPSGSTFPISRNFEVAYKTLKWETDKWTDLDTIVKISDPSTEIEVPSPLKDTSFKLSGDLFATELGLDAISIESAPYTPVAVKCHPTTEVSIREELNEEDRPTTATQISGSAPLDILFKANANDPVANNYSWKIYNDSVEILTRNEKEHRYTFTQAGVFKVKLTAGNKFCVDSANVVITVSESELYAPNVFTPNGDGKNDEFRVAYKSIIEFQCWVFNRWGRQIFTWTNPQKGWDGTYNGKPAVPGPYFYVIKAMGSDKVPHNLKGSINLLRGVK